MLNADFDFSMATLSIKGAFIGIPEKMFLEPGTKLYKWTDYPLVGPQGITPWWSFFTQSKLPSGLVAEGFQETERLAVRLNTPHQNYQRVRSAVSEKFNNKMSNLLVTQLTLGCWGFAGRTSGQAEFKNPALRNVYLIGGKCQVWIPNLTLAHIREVPN